MRTILAALLVAALAAAAQAFPAVSAVSGPSAGEFEAQFVGAARVFLAAPPAPGALSFQARSPWQELVDKLLAWGTFREADQTLPATYGLADLRGTAAGPHVADYANVWGFGDSTGHFQPAFLTFVSEDWAVDAQNRWVIHQWLFTLGLDGSAAAVSRHLIVETRDGSVLDYQSQPLKPGDAEAVAEQRQLLAQWSAFHPR